MLQPRWIERQLASKILRLAKGFPAVVLTGPRQVGKTSLLRRLIPNYNYCSLDLPSLAIMAEESPQEFLEKIPSTSHY